MRVVDSGRGFGRVQGGYEVLIITFNFNPLGDIMPGEISLIENELGDLLKQIIREEDQED